MGAVLTLRWGSGTCPALSWPIASTTYCSSKKWFWFWLFVCFCSAATSRQRWSSVEESCCLKSRSCSVWGRTSPWRHFRSNAWRRVCSLQKQTWLTKTTWVRWFPLCTLEKDWTFSYHFSLDLIFILVLCSCRSGGKAPLLWSRPAQLCQQGPDPGGTAADGPRGVDRHAGAATEAERHSAENTNHRRRATGLCGKTDCPA